MYVVVLFGSWLCFGWMGCEKFETINTNPNAPTVTNPDFLLSESLVKGAGQFGSGIHTEIWTLMLWTQMMADINGIPQAGQEYAYSGSYNDEQWREWFSHVLSNTNELKKLTAGDPYLVNLNSAARIWQAFIFHKITDLWGDIPYSEALQGLNSDNQNLTPAYDRQEDIYAELLNELKEAADQFDPSQKELGTADVLFAGNIHQWARFANSLRLRLAIRISAANQTLAEQHISELLAEDNLISNNSESALFPFNETRPSPFFELHDLGQGMRNPSQFLVEKLEDTEDPRLPFFAERTSESLVLGDTIYTGVPNLELSSNLTNYSDFNTSAVGDFFLKASKPGVLISYAEVCFLQAEAALKGLGGATSARTHYENGVRANMETFGIDATAIDDFLTHGGVFDGSLEKVITQKWLTFVYNDAYEAFAERRRTGFPEFLNPEGNTISQNEFPQRLAYPPSELSLNSANVQSVGEGIDDFSTPVWWAN